MSTYTIGETAERSGFTASALRYYEGIGLVVPTARTDAGYRVYDDDALARLAFIDRAKRLGCSLEEITDLVAIWDGERCGPVQQRFHELVTTKILDVRRQLGELTDFAAQLRSAAAQLGGQPVDGPCGDGCACMTEAGNRAMPDKLTRRHAPTIACMLDAGAMPERLAEWRAVLDHAVSRSGCEGGLRIQFADTTRLDELARLVLAEQQCCAFFSFAITVDGRGVGLEVRAPRDAGELVASIFGAAA